MDEIVQGAKGILTEPSPRENEMTPIRKIGIIGSGQMGNGIAHVIALSGYEVVLNDLTNLGYASNMQGSASSNQDAYDAPMDFQWD